MTPQPRKRGARRALTVREQELFMLVKMLIGVCDRWIDRGSSTTVERARDYAKRLMRLTDILRTTTKGPRRG